MQYPIYAVGVVESKENSEGDKFYGVRFGEVYFTSTDITTLENSVVGIKCSDPGDSGHPKIAIGGTVAFRLNESGLTAMDASVASEFNGCYCGLDHPQPDWYTEIVNACPATGVNELRKLCQ